MAESKNGDATGGGEGEAEGAGDMWEEYEYRHKSGAAGVFYYHHGTGKSQYEEPPCLVGVPHQLYHDPAGPAWHAYVDDAGLLYFYNHVTHASQYEQPSAEYIPLRTAYREQYPVGAPAMDAVGDAGTTNTAGPSALPVANVAAVVASSPSTDGEASDTTRPARETHSTAAYASHALHDIAEEGGDVGAAGPDSTSVDASGVAASASVAPASGGPAPVTGVARSGSVVKRVRIVEDLPGGQGLSAQQAHDSGSRLDSDDGWSSDSSGDSLMPWVPGLPASTPSSTVFRTFRWQSLCHAVVCESPALVVEALGRGIMNVLGAMATLLVALAQRRRVGVAWRVAQRRLWEAVVCFMCVPTFLIPPLLAMSVYRDMAGDGSDWLLRPLWTLAGDVDARRFRIVRAGNGAFAANVTVGDDDRQQMAGAPASRTHAGSGWPMDRICTPADGGAQHSRIEEDLENGQHFQPSDASCGDDDQDLGGGVVVQTPKQPSRRRPRPVRSALRSATRRARSAGAVTPIPIELDSSFEGANGE